MRGEGPSADMALTQLGTACHLLARLLWPQALSLVHLSRLRFSQNCCSCFSVPTSILPGALRSPIAPLLTPGLARLHWLHSRSFPFQRENGPRGPGEADQSGRG